MMISIICQLKYMRWQSLLVFRRVPVLGGVLVQDGIRIRRNVLVRIERNKPGRPDTRVNVVRHETFTQTSDDDVV
jgi:hypothetical protein